MQTRYTTASFFFFLKTWKNFYPKPANKVSVVLEINFTFSLSKRSRFFLLRHNNCVCTLYRICSLYWHMNKF